MECDNHHNCCRHRHHHHYYVNNCSLHAYNEKCIIRNKICKQFTHLLTGIKMTGEEYMNKNIIITGIHDVF